MLSMSKMSKIDQIHLRAVMLCMSKTSKIVFAAFMQHCMQSYSFCYSCRRCRRCKILWIINQRLQIHTNMFLLITSLIVNGFSIRKKVLESWDLGLSNDAIKSYVCRRMSKMSKIDQVHLRAVMLFMSETSEIVIIFNRHRVWWYGWKALSLSFPKLFSDWKSVKY